MENRRSETIMGRVWRKCNDVGESSEERCGKDLKISGIANRGIERKKEANMNMLVFSYQVFSTAVLRSRDN